MPQHILESPADRRERFQDYKRYRRHNLLYDQLKQGLRLLIYDELEKTRRYWAFRIERLISRGLDCVSNAKIEFEGNKMRLIIEIEVPERFIREGAEEMLKTTENEYKNGDEYEGNNNSPPR